MPEPQQQKQDWVIAAPAGRRSDLGFRYPYVQHTLHEAYGCAFEQAQEPRAGTCGSVKVSASAR